MSTTVEIGSLRERVEILDPPVGGPRPRIGRIRHANGENAAVDHETLLRLVQRAERAAEGAAVQGTGGKRGHGVLIA